ncbi:hypothetical protein DL93DRAFT_2224604 [Clavulina sp. PMI_390]|nr:hypothetical protein DL93DRAFT_2224604 [Clavulina sp. PMI_390]
MEAPNGSKDIPEPSSSSAAFQSLNISDFPIDKATLFEGRALIERVVTLYAQNGSNGLELLNLPSGIDLRSLRFSLHSPTSQIILHGLQVLADQPKSSRKHQAQGSDRHSLCPPPPLQGLDDEQLLLHAALARRKDRLALRLQGYERSAQLMNSHVEKYADSLSYLPTRYEPRQTSQHPNKFGLSPCDHSSSWAFNKLELLLDSYADFLESLFEKWQDTKEEIDCVAHEIDHLLAIAQQARERELLRGILLETAPSVNIFLQAEERGEVDIRLSYIVDGPTWSPAYTLSAISGQDSDNAPSRVQLDYQAIVAQNTGEDWSNVQLMLSTGSGPLLESSASHVEPLATQPPPQLVPSQSFPANPPKSEAPTATVMLASPAPEPPSASPTLSHFELSITTNQSPPNSSGPDPSDLSQFQPREASPDASNSLTTSQLPPKDERPTGNTEHQEDRTLVHSTGEIVQVQASSSNIGDLNRPEPESPVRGRIISASLPPSLPFLEVGTGSICMRERGSIRSSASTQHIPIQRLTLDAQFAWVAVPRLREDVILECMIQNNSRSVLLPGPCFINVEGLAVGQHLIPYVQPNEAFTLPLGVADGVKMRTHISHRPKSLEATANTSRRGTETEICSFSQRISILNTYDFPITIIARDAIPVDSHPNVNEKGKRKETDNGTESLEPGWVAIRPGVTARWARNAEFGSVRSSGDGVAEWRCVKVKPLLEVETELAWDAVTAQGPSNTSNSSS